MYNLLSKFINKEEVGFFRRKSSTYQFLEERGIAIPELYYTATEEVSNDLFDHLPEEFVMKPDIGASGRGIMLLRKHGGGYIDTTGEVYTVESLVWRVNAVIKNKGTLLNDSYLFQQWLGVHEDLRKISPRGIVDFRMYFVNKRFLYCRMRIPTPESCGLANVAKGAVVVTVVEDGTVTDTPYWKDGTEPDFLGAVNPTTGESMLGYEVPHWSRIMEGASMVPPHLSSRLVCVDGTLCPDDRFRVIEVTLAPSAKPFTGHEHLLQELNRV